MTQERDIGRRALLVLFGMNGVMFVVELVAGWRAESMGLLADGLDMGADAAVYLLALLAVGASAQRKIQAAQFAGRVQLALALLAILEVVRRLIAGSAPEPPIMMIVSFAALTVNIGCLVMLRRHREGEVHLQAAWIFSATDVQANLGVLTAALLVDVLDSAIPDLIIGLAISWLVLRGALRIRRRVTAARER